MSFASKWAISRRDNNDKALAELATEMGAILRKTGPLDYEVWWRGISTHWYHMDIKDPAKFGHANEFTKAQKAFMAECKDIGAHFEIWRMPYDIVQSRELARRRRAA